MSPRSLLLLGLAATLAVSAACGGSSPSPKTAPTSTVTAERGDATEPAPATATPKTGVSGASGGGLSSIFGSVLGSGLSGGRGAAGAGVGDESLKRFLPESSDFPPGYAPTGEFTFSSPDGVSESGKIDIAMTMAVQGDVTQANPDFSKLSILLAMVMKPEDLQALGGAFAQIKNMTKEDIQNEIESGLGHTQGFDLLNFEVLDADGLGEGGFGLQMSFDLGAFAGIFGGMGADAPSAVTMRMYLFAQGDYMGATLRMAFTDGLATDSIERGLADVLEGKLKGG